MNQARVTPDRPARAIPQVATAGVRQALGDSPQHLRGRGAWSPPQDKSGAAYVHCSAVSLTLRSLVEEKVLVDLLDVERLLNPHADVVADHQGSELIAVYQDDALAQSVRCAFSGSCKC